MKTKLLLAAVTMTMGLFVASCDDNNGDNNTTPQINQTDKDFLTSFAKANLGQITLNQLAADSGTNTGLATYTQSLIQHYKAAQRTLDTIAMRYNFTLPTQPDSSVTNFRTSLLGTPRGRGFDSTFLANQITLLDAQITELNRGTQQATESRLKNFVNQQLPMIQQQRINTDSLRLRL